VEADVAWRDQERPRPDVGGDRGEEPVSVRVAGGEHALAQRVGAGMEVADDAQVITRVEGGGTGRSDLDVG
jgi:hypothetical protein